MDVRPTLRALARLVVPVECAGCGLFDEPLCVPCAGTLGGPVRCEDGAGRLDRVGEPALPVWALGPYEGPARRLVIAWKDHGREDLDGVLTAGIRRAAREAGAAFDGIPGGVAVVPAPSTRASQATRGRAPVEALAAAVAAGLADRGIEAAVVRGLALRGGAHRQKGLGARDRAANLRGRVRPTRRGARLVRRAVVLVDDVLTTGATLAACDAALLRLGAVGVGAFVVAATPLRGGAGRPGSSSDTFWPSPCREEVTAC